MADFEALPPDVLKVVSAQIGTHLQGFGSKDALGGGPLTLTESFSVWFLKASDSIQPTDDLTLLAVDTGRWHHQVANQKGAFAFARSIPKGPEATSWSVREVTESGLANQIDDAITWIDANVPQHLTTRLLSVPAYHVTAFWLIDPANPRNQIVVVVSSPPGNKLLVTHKTYTSKEFLDALRTSDHIRGLNPG